jgi:hypothetical protein
MSGRACSCEAPGLGAWDFSTGTGSSYADLFGGTSGAGGSGGSAGGLSPWSTLLTTVLGAGTAIVNQDKAADIARDQLRASLEATKQAQLQAAALAAQGGGASSLFKSPLLIGGGVVLLLLVLKK